MRLPKIIFDDGTPSCLPRWARDELVEGRFARLDLKKRNADLRKALSLAEGKDYMTAVFDGMDEIQS